MTEKTVIQAGGNELLDSADREKRLAKLVSELNEAKNQAKAHLDFLINLIKAESSQVEIADDFSRDELLIQLGELLESTDQDDQDFLSKSKVMLTILKKLVKDLGNEKLRLHNLINHKANEYERALQEQWLLGRAKGAKAIRRVFNNRRVAKRIEILGSEIKDLETQLDDVSGLCNQYDEYRDRLGRLRRRRLGNMVFDQVAGIRINFEDVYTQIISDGTIVNDFRETYIEKFIRPRANEIAKSRKYPEESVIEFIDTLKAYLDHIDGPDEVAEEHKEELWKFFKSEAKISFIDVATDCEELYQGLDINQIKKILVELAIKYINPIYDAVAEADLGFLDHYISLGIHDEKRPSPNSFSFALVQKKIFPRDSELSLEQFEMRRWLPLKSSEFAMALFGDEIRERDALIYNMALSNSLSDTKGIAVNLLYYYPTPEAIKNLVIIAAADLLSHRTLNVNTALANLGKMPEWGLLLDQAEQVYPELADVRETLQNWNHTTADVEPNLRSGVKSLALRMLENNDDQDSITVITQSLNNEELVKLLKDRGLVADQVSTAISQAIEFLYSEPVFDDEKPEEKKDQKLKYHLYTFESELRRCLLNALSDDENKSKKAINAIKNFGSLSQEILKNKKDLNAILFLLRSPVVIRMDELPNQDEILEPFFNSSQQIPELRSDSRLLNLFCQDYKERSSIEFFKQMVSTYRQDEEVRNELIELVIGNKLSRKRAIELADRASDLFRGKYIDQIKNIPRLFLETDDGLKFLRILNESGLFDLDDNLDRSIGNRVAELEADKRFKIDDIVKIANIELKKIEDILLSGDQAAIDSLTWQQLLLAFVVANSETFKLKKYSEAAITKINEIFQDSAIKNLCLNELQASWRKVLGSGETSNLPMMLKVLIEIIDLCEGVDFLTQVDSLTELISTVFAVFGRETTFESTKVKIFTGLEQMEQRFQNEKWSNDDIIYFYNISKAILTTDPGILSDFLNLFSKLSPSEMKTFSSEIYPLYATLLVMLEEVDDRGRISVSIENLTSLRNDIRNFSEIFSNGKVEFNNQKENLISKIREQFKSRFGIIKIPENFSPEQMRSFLNLSKYLANLRDRTPEKEGILGFYLSLIINNLWEDFKKGLAVDPTVLLDQEHSLFIQQFLENRKKLNPLTPENIGIDPEDLPEFMSLLQQEASNVVIGDIETIDIKLMNIVLNLKGLEDLDLYNREFDKRRMELLLKYGHRKVGSVVARTYQSLTNTDRRFEFSEEDLEIQQSIIKILEDSGFSVSQESLKEHFQDGIKPLSMVVNVLAYVEETGAEEEIRNLRDLLKPSNAVIKIFNKLGEEFKSSSGALALSQDLNYLENIVVKREDELSPDEILVVKEYIEKIRSQVVVLEGIYNQIKNKLSGLRQGSHAAKNELLAEKLEEIDSIVNTQESHRPIVSTVTHNLNIIIENIRECLSCTKNGGNNDTNLTFGDLNKFYLFSQDDSQKRGSISDQIVFFEPITGADGYQGLAFVLDRIYGVQTPTVLENHIEVMLKKLRSIKQRFPEAKISVFVTSAAIQTGGNSAELLLERMKEKGIIGKRETLSVDVVRSATGDHYIEFGGRARSAGTRTVSGVQLFAK